MSSDAHASDRYVESPGDGRAIPDGTLAGSSTGKRTRSTKRGSASEQARLKEALRLFAKRGRLTKQERIAALELSFGSGKGRPDWKGKSSAEIVQEIRRRTRARLGRRRNA